MSVQSRREREREERYREILEAAERVFHRRGAAATMDEIAAEAGIAKGTVYLYFHTKEDLHLVLLGKAIDTLRARFERAVAEPGTVAELVRNIGRQYTAYFRDDTALFHILNGSGFPAVSDAVSPEILELVFAKSNRLMGLLVGVLQRGIDEGVLRDDVTAFEMAVIFWSNASGLLRMIDAVSGPNIWRRMSGGYTLYALDLYRLLDVSGELLLTSLLRRPAGTGPADRPGADT